MDIIPLRFMHKNIYSYGLKYKNIVISGDARYIPKVNYEYLKNCYLNKNRSMHTLYIEINQKTKVDRHLFFNLINKK